jgi:UDP-arabinose 4-epimerase
MPKRILVAGGAGYIGSHTCKILSESGFIPVVYDDLRRGNSWSVRWGPFVKAALEDKEALARTMKAYKIAAVIHFAGYAYIEESMNDPSIYFKNNFLTTINLLDAMVEVGVKPIVISSTCATYGIPQHLPIRENTPLKPINPYGASKVMVEELARWYGACHGIKTFALRYFNAAGADPDGLIGEHHVPEPHLLPIVVEATLGQRLYVRINGTDYQTPDGTAIRDYIHVIDLALAHVSALRYLLNGGESNVANLGTGKGISILEVIEKTAEIAGRRPRVVEGLRRSGDPPILIANPETAHKILGWRAKYSEISTIVRTAVQWHRDILPAIKTNEVLCENAQNVQSDCRAA